MLGLLAITSGSQVWSALSLVSGSREPNWTPHSSQPSIAYLVVHLRYCYSTTPTTTSIHPSLCSRCNAPRRLFYFLNFFFFLHSQLLPSLCQWPSSNGDFPVEADWCGIPPAHTAPSPNPVNQSMGFLFAFLHTNSQPT